MKKNSNTTLKGSKQFQAQISDFIHSPALEVIICTPTNAGTGKAAGCPTVFVVEYQRRKYYLLSYCMTCRQVTPPPPADQYRTGAGKVQIITDQILDYSRSRLRDLATNTGIRL